MSINLKMKDLATGKECHLWQTSSWTTRVCLSIGEDGETPDGGHEAVRRRYVVWVNSHIEGTWHSLSELDEQKKIVKGHIRKVMAVKEPYFYCS